MKKELLLWCVVGALIIVGLVAAMWPSALAQITVGASHALEAPTMPASDVLFVGDIMLDRTVADHAREVGDQALFAGVQDLFAASHLRIGNLEGTITDNKSIAEVDHSTLRFTFAPKYAQLLGEVGFDALSSANNHSLDFGEDGYQQTRQNLSTAGIASFGSALNNEHLAVMLKVQGRELCVVGYMQLFNPDPTAVIQKIKDIRSQCDYIVVMPHWGVEYQHEPTAAQVDLAHQFIDAGADIIIGGHPHVVEPLEIYKGKAIFYSLGNFLFDQAFSPQVLRGLTVGITFEDSATKFTLVPVNTFQEVSIADATTTQATLEDVVTPSLPADIANSILTTGTFELVK
jgi:poly-gamma-glutamate synthesis protein (capsule biosynthesis protein)